MSKSGTRKNYLWRLRSSVTSTFKCLIKDCLLWRDVMSTTLRNPEDQDGRKKGMLSNQPRLTRVTPTLLLGNLGTTTNGRYDVPQDWLQDACQMARVHLGTCCKGFCSKEGLHYCIERSARNPLEHDQVQRALGKSSRSCRQTSNN